MKAGKVLVMQDDKALVEQLKTTLGREFDLLITPRPDEAVRLLKNEEPDLVLFDLGLPRCPNDPAVALQVLRDLQTAGPHTKVIVCTDLTGHEAGRQALSLGAYDIIYGPFSADALRATVRRVCWISRLEQEDRIESVEPVEEGESCDEIVGTSLAMRHVFEMVRKIATTDIPVLITGETGTGKELTARAIHARSQQKNGPFVAINCGAIPDTLLESELFGYERGAFTGALQQKKGKIEGAAQGTLFLDEAGELAPALQVKLLRFLQEGTFERVGGRETLNVNTRVIAATNLNLKEAIKKSSFREDLYYRLGGLHIDLPPLRERGEDIVLMATLFLKRAAGPHQKRIRGYSPEAVDAIRAHSWPGNVRELSNRIRRAVVMAEGAEITPRDLDLTCDAATGANGLDSLRASHRRIETELIVKAMNLRRGNLSRAAQDLEISRSTLYRKIREYHLDQFLHSPILPDS